MDKNFDERKALQDLREILNHVYSIANNYYAELQTAHSLNSDRAAQISSLKTSHEKDITDLLSGHETDIKKLREEISSLKNQLVAQDEKFRADLKEYGDYNVELTKQLETFQRELSESERELNRRETEISQRENDIAQREKNLETAQKTFEEEKTRFEQEHADYDDLKAAAKNHDIEIQNLHNQYSGKISALETLRDENAKTINKKQARIEELEQQILNRDGQISQLNKRIESLQKEQGGGYENGNESM